MEELAKVRRVIGQRLEGAPHETLLVIDATTGQNGLQQARLFGQAVDVTGIVLTKLDGTAKGGIVIAIADELGLPMKLIGIGAGLEDLRVFRRAGFRPRTCRRGVTAVSRRTGIVFDNDGLLLDTDRAGRAPKPRSSSAMVTSST